MLETEVNVLNANYKKWFGRRPQEYLRLLLNWRIVKELFMVNYGLRTGCDSKLLLYINVSYN